VTAANCRTGLARASAIFGAAIFCSALAGCATTSARKADAAVILNCAVDDARVYVDETFVGRAVELRNRALPVASGTLRVEVRADGYFTAYRDLPVPKGARGRLDVALRPVPDGEPGG
jgi:hypothetical protein